MVRSRHGIAMTPAERTRGGAWWRLWTGATRVHRRCADCGAALDVSQLMPGNRARCGGCGSVFVLCLDELSAADPAAKAANGNGAASVLMPPSLEAAAPLTESQAHQLLQKPPKRIGPYLIEREIARGGTAVVYCGRHETLFKPVAVKLLLPGMASSEEMGRRLLREALALARFRHPHIVPVLDGGATDEGLHYLVMEYVDGEDLSRLLTREKPMDWRRAFTLLAQVIEAIDFAHAHGVIHRDLKPGNILLEGDGQTAQIADFGLARDEQAHSRLTRTGVALGTPTYMPPEQATGSREHIDRCSDIYSLGAIAYEMLTGKPPFEGQTVMETLFKVVHHEPPAPRQLQPKIPREIEAIVQKAMQKDPSKRYASAYQMLGDVKACLAGELPPVAWAGRGSVLGRVLRRTGLSGWQAALVLLVLVLGLGWLAERGHAQNRFARALRDGRELLQDGKLDEADKRFEEALKLDPENPKVYEGRREVRRAREALQAAKERNSANGTAGPSKEAVNQELEKRFATMTPTERKAIVEGGPQKLSEFVTGVWESLKALGGDEGMIPAPRNSNDAQVSRLTVSAQAAGTKLTLRPATGGAALGPVQTAPATWALTPGVYALEVEAPDQPPRRVLLPVEARKPVKLKLDGEGKVIE
ncbi:MAG: protein kinase [Planctomycetes bacterium]|nr:protein kinase [Planctomycetota bacterium]